MTLDQLKHDTYMYQTKMSAIISEDLMEQSIEFIKNTENQDTKQLWKGK